MMKTPKLRFKEFSGEWEEKKIGELGNVVTGNTPSTSDRDNYGNEYLWASPADLGNVKYINNTVKKLSYKGFSKVRNVPKGSILVTCIGSTIGKIGIASEEMGSNQQINTLICSENLNNEFSYYSLNYNFPKYLSYVTSQAVPIINKSQFQDFTIKVSSLKEQEKIADFFSLIDDKISLQGKKVKALKDYKKGMMQKIFSRKLRFKDDEGRDYPEWEEKKLKDYTEKITSKNKNFLITNVISNSAKNGLISQRDFFDKDIANQSNIDGYYVIEYGDFVYNPRKSIESPYGPINRYELKNSGVVSPLYLCFRVNKKINGKFLAYYFKSSIWHRFIYQNSDQGARHDRVSIKDSEFFNMNIKTPVLEEQNKIVKFLDSLEYKLNKEQSKLDSLNEYKKGLLQQMFV